MANVEWVGFGSIMRCGKGEPRFWAVKPCVDGRGCSTGVFRSAVYVLTDVRIGVTTQSLEAPCVC